MKNPLKKLALKVKNPKTAQTLSPAGVSGGNIWTPPDLDAIIQALRPKTTVKEYCVSVGLMLLILSLVVGSFLLNYGTMNDLAKGTTDTYYFDMDHFYGKSNWYQFAGYMTALGIFTFMAGSLTKAFPYTRVILPFFVFIIAFYFFSTGYVNNEKHDRIDALPASETPFGVWAEREYGFTVLEQDDFDVEPDGRFFEVEDDRGRVVLIHTEIDEENDRMTLENWGNKDNVENSEKWVMDTYGYTLVGNLQAGDKVARVQDPKTEEYKNLDIYLVDGKMYLAENNEDLETQLKEVESK